MMVCRLRLPTPPKLPDQPHRKKKEKKVLAVALYDFDEMDGTTLTFREDDVLEIVEQDEDEGWWLARHYDDDDDDEKRAGGGGGGGDDGEEEGYVPANYLKLL